MPQSLFAQLDEVFDQFHRSVIAHGAAVDAQMITGGLSPFFLGLEIVEAGTLLIRLVYNVPCLRLRAFFILCHTGNAHIQAGRDKHRHQVRAVPQDIIRTAADNDAVAFILQLADGIKLCLEDLLIEGGSHIIHGRIYIHDDGVEQAVCR